MTVTIYKSTDASAPVLNGNNGSLITVLDAILVNGYGSKAPAGWSRPFSGTNQAVYRMAAGVQHYLQVNDNSPNGAAVGREARLRGFVSMSDLTTGVEPYPTTAQVGDTAGPMIRKSTTADGTARAWKAFADGRTLYFFNNSGDFSPGYTAYMFGEFTSLKSNNSYRSAVIGRVVSAGAGAATGAQENLDTFSAIGSSAVGHYMARRYQGDIAGAAAFGKHGHAAHSTTRLFGLGSFPNVYGTSLMLSQVWLNAAIGTPDVMVGRLRGFWHFLHPISTVADGAVFHGSGPLTGRSFEVVKSNGQLDGVYVIEISDTWETS